MTTDPTTRDYVARRSSEGKTKKGGAIARGFVQTGGLTRLDDYAMKVEANDDSHLRIFRFGDVRAFNQSKVRVHNSLNATLPERRGEARSV